MTVGEDPLVFDTGPLRHFALRGWIGALRFITQDRGVVIPESVHEELRRQADDEVGLRAVLDVDWIAVDRTDDIAFTASFAGFEERLVVGGRNRGECGVLAMGAVYGWELVLDDSVPRSIAENSKMRVTATVPLLCQAIRAKQLTVSMAEQLADDLIVGEYYLPFGRGGFKSYCVQEGLIDY